MFDLITAIVGIVGVVAYTFITDTPTYIVVQGVVVHSDVRPSHRCKSAFKKVPHNSWMPSVRYAPHIAYKYHYNGRIHHNYTVSYPDMSYCFRYNAEWIVFQYKPGAIVDVYINPHNPQRSCLCLPLRYTLLPVFVLVASSACVWFVMDRCVDTLMC